MSATQTLEPTDEIGVPETGWARVLAATRIQFLSRSVLVWPWAVLAAALAVNLFAFAVLDTDEADPTTGGLVSIYVVVLIVMAQSVSQFLPFSLGLGVTRRDFYAAAVLGALGQALVYGTGLTLLLAVEELTDGWGLGLQFFGVSSLVADDPVSQVLAYAAPLLLVGSLGLLWGAISLRWGGTGIFVGLIVSVFLLGGLLALLGLLDAWSALGDFFTDSPTLVAVAMPSLVLAAVLGAVGYTIVRRTAV